MDSTSPLKNLPRNLAVKQALFLDGLAHAAEIALFAYVRLQSSLLAITEAESASSDLFVPSYLDAWSCVDAIHRFDSLLKQYPKGGIIVRDAEQSAYLLGDGEIRELRNVADHVASRVDQLVSKKASALGELSWICRVGGIYGNTYSMNIRPGFFGREVSENFRIPPPNEPIHFPVGFIHLKAGGKSANLSRALTSLQAIVRHIEHLLQNRYAVMGGAYAPCNRDLVMKVELKEALPAQAAP